MHCRAGLHTDIARIDRLKESNNLRIAPEMLVERPRPIAPDIVKALASVLVASLARIAPSRPAMTLVDPE
jgi:hypothetical protein